MKLFELETELRRLGWEPDRINGSHRMYTDPYGVMVSFSMHAGGDISNGLLHEMEQKIRRAMIQRQSIMERWRKEGRQLPPFDLEWVRLLNNKALLNGNGHKLIERTEKEGQAVEQGQAEALYLCKGCNRMYPASGFQSDYWRTHFRRCKDCMVAQMHRAKDAYKVSVEKQREEKQATKLETLAATVEMQEAPPEVANPVVSAIVAKATHEGMTVQEFSALIEADTPMVWASDGLCVMWDGSALFVLTTKGDGPGQPLTMQLAHYIVRLIGASGPGTLFY